MTEEQILTKWQRFMRLQWIWERTRFEYIERLSETRQAQYAALAECCKKEMKQIDPLFQTPMYGFYPRAYLDWMKKRWLEI